MNPKGVYRCLICYRFFLGKHKFLTHHGMMHWPKKPTYQIAPIFPSNMCQYCGKKLLGPQGRMIHERKCKTRLKLKKGQS